ncbi:MAG: hypothetical protein Q7S52_00270 [bacterium]|nr:hypothetical protein [bacterium]
MDKLHNLAIVSRIKSMFAPDGERKIGSVHFVWHAILGVMFFFVIAIAMLAWFSYEWAIKETAMPFSRTSRDAFSIEELRSVIEVYQKKEADHAALRQARLQAPSLGTEINISTNVGN